MDALSAGISVIPPRQNGSKAPDCLEWKSAQRVRATEAQLLEQYRPGRTGVGWITGGISGNLEVLDFDDRSTWSEYQKLCREAGIGALLDRVIAGYLEHTPNGAHLIYRCPSIEGNQKLAQGADKKSLIETRGEGGYIIVAPSHGSVNLKGSYVLQSGGVSSIASITPAERRELFDVAKIFDESPQAIAAPPRISAAAGRPGDDYNARASWDDVLQPHGWVRVGGRLGVVSWRRPGKDRGISATTNHADSGLLYVFSSSTEFEANRGYSKFSAYALLTHGGNFTDAARQLSLDGYGIEAPVVEEVDLSLILAARNPIAKAAPTDFADLLRVPGLVGDIAEWIDAGAIKSQPVLALGAAIAAFSTLLGRKARIESNARSNLYILGVGETGCGKERARQAIGKLFNALGLDSHLGDSFASDAAVETAVMQAPVRLYLIDEMGYFLGTMRDELAPSHVRSIVPVLLKLYSSSEGVYRKRTYAHSEARRDDVAYVDQPCLSIYGTTVPSNFYANVTKSHITNGLLSRLLVFESDNPDPDMRWPLPVDGPVPECLIEGCKLWVNRSICADSEAGNIEARTVPAPLYVRATAAAIDVYKETERKMKAQREAERAAGRDHGPYTRVTTTGMKLALVRACGVNPDHPEITEADAAWGTSLAMCLTERFMTKVGDAAPENKTEAAAQRVLRVIDEAQSISRQKLIRRTRFLTSRQLDEVVKTLLEAGDVVADIAKATNGNQKTTYRSASWLPGKSYPSLPDDKIKNTTGVN